MCEFYFKNYQIFYSLNSCKFRKKFLIISEIKSKSSYNVSTTKYHI